MKMIAALMLAGTFLLAQPAFAGDKEGDAPAEKAPKSKKKDKADKGDKKDAPKANAPKPEEKKADKGGW